MKIFFQSVYHELPIPVWKKSRQFFSYIFSPKKQYLIIITTKNKNGNCKKVIKNIKKKKKEIK